MKTNQLFKNALTAILLFTSTVIPVSIYAQTNDISNDTKIEIEKLNHQMEIAITKKSLGDIAVMYGDDATILTPEGKKLHGRKMIGDFWYSMSNCREFKSEITELGGNGKMVYQLGKWTLTVEKEGKLVTFITDVVLIWKRESNYQYKIQLNSFNNSIALSEKEIPSNSAQAK